MEIDEIVKLLEEGADTASDWHSIGTFLRKQTPEEREHPLWKFVFAFEYIHVEDSNKDYFERYGLFAPWIEMQDVVFPPPLNTIKDDFLADWYYALGMAKNPIICSRLADLLWVRKWGERPDLFARQAIDCYVEVSKGEWIEIERTFCLNRALDLSKEINDTERKTNIILLTIDSCYQELRSENQKPGVSLRLIETLMKLPKTDIPSEVDNLLELAFNVYQENVWVIENILELMTKRVDTDKQKEIRILQINRWVAEAEKGGRKGIARLGDLQHALEIARNYGFQEIANDIRHRIQSTSEEDLNLSTFSKSINLPKEEMDKFISSFIDTKGWPESLIKFGSYGPPSGNYKKNIENVEQESQKNPLSFLITRFVYQDDNALIKIGKNLEENKAIALVDHETMYIGVFGQFAPEIIRQIKDKFGSPSVEDMTSFFTTSIIPGDVAENIAISLDYYNKGEYDIATHLLVPRLEAVIRIVAREIGLVIIQEPIGEKPGGVIQLGSLLTRMQGRMDESWRRYFYNCLADPLGINLRNRICHGLLPKASLYDASLLIHIACNLKLLEIHQTPAEETNNPDEENPTRPK
jgi:hypothetical protein